MSDVLILTSGTRGDVDPYLVLGSALAALGHRVRIAAHTEHRELASTAGYEALALPANPSGLLVDLSRDLRRDAGFLDRAGSVARYWRRAERRYRDMAEAATEYIRPSDLVILGLPTIWLYPVARAMGARVVVCPLQPLTASSTYASVLLPGLPCPPGPASRWSHALGLGAISLPWANALGRWARESPWAPRFSPLGPMRALLADRVPFVYAISPLVFPRPRDWPSNHVLGGYWLSDQGCAPSGAEGNHLRSFLAADPQPVVFVDFGSLEYLYRELLARLPDALRVVGCRALIRTRNPIMAAGDPGAPGLLRVRGPLPHDWVLERVAAMVHHGGAGTTARVARAGIPSLPVPSAADGAFWARRARMMRISPPAIAPGAGRRELERTLERLVRSPMLRSRAEALGRELRREGGAGPAADLIDRIARRSR